VCVHDDVAPAGDVGRRADVILVAVRQQQALYVGTVIAKLLDRFAYQWGRPGHACVDEGQTGSILPQIDVADGKSEQVQLGKQLDDLHETTLGGRDRRNQ
jgi:hypothetical protein